VGVIAASVALVGCGGKRATRASVIARGNAICASAERALANLPPASGASGTTVDFIKAAPIVTHEAQTLGALPRPATDRALLDRFLAAESQLAAGYRHLAAVQRAGDDVAERSGIAVLAHSDAASLARRYGLTQCGAATATVR
jgi:hypothetical protein